MVGQFYLPVHDSGSLYCTQWASSAYLYLTMAPQTTPGGIVLPTWYLTLGPATTLSGPALPTCTRPWLPILYVVGQLCLPVPELNCETELNEPSDGFSGQPTSACPWFHRHYLKNSVLPTCA